jgi:transposase
MTSNAGHTQQDTIKLQQLLGEREAEIAKQSAELLARDLLIEKLKLQLANLRRHRFGSKSEALDKIIDQLELALFEAEATATSHQSDGSTPAPKPKRKPKREPLPDHLPREDVVLNPGETCGQCGGALRHLGEDVTETLEYVPGRFKVIRTIRPKLSCRCCETIHQVPAPSMPIERGRMGPGLMAHVLVSKYADHLPLYRQSQIYNRERVSLERSTLSDGVRCSTDLLEVLADAIGRHAMAGAAIHADDTPVKVLAPGTGKTKTGRLWVYLRDERDWAGDHHPAAFYKFTRIEKAAGHEIISKSSMAGCMPMAMLASKNFIGVVASRKLPVLPISDGNSLISMLPRVPALQKKPWNALPRCTS